MSRLLNGFIAIVLLSASVLGAESARGGSAAPAVDRSEVCQTAVLRNGFAVQYVRREAVGATTRLWVCADAGAGYVEFPTGEIQLFDQGGITVPPPETPVGARTTSESGNSVAEDSVKKFITGAAWRYQIDPDFVASVVRAESGFNSQAVSNKGAQGLMQLMPQTATTLGVGNAFDPAANVEGGTKYLRQLLDQYNGDAVKALAAYNAGPQRVEQYGGVPPYIETREFITRVIDDFNRKKLRQQADSPAPHSSSTE